MICRDLFCSSCWLVYCGASIQSDSPHMQSTEHAQERVAESLEKDRGQDGWDHMGTLGVLIGYNNVLLCPML